MTRLLLIAFLCLTQEGHAQSVVIRLSKAERSVHTWAQENHVLPVSLVTATLSQAWYASAWYARKSHLIHPAQTAFTWSIHAAAYAVLDRRTDYLAFSLLSDGAFQMFVNHGVGRPLIYHNEPATWDLYGHPIPKPFYGRGRWVQIVIGAGLIIIPRL